MVHLPPILNTEAIAPSAEQCPAVLNRGHDVVVTAGAGAGKTRALVGRYLSLLYDGYPLRSIVAITFTRKAAREMRIRIRQVVRDYQEQLDPEHQDYQRWQDIYLALDSARIDTIHSLCAEILRLHPAEAGVDPAFDVLEEGQSYLLQQQAVNAGMALTAMQDNLVSLYGVFGERSLHGLLSDLIRRRLDAEPAFDTLPDNLEDRWRNHIDAHSKKALSRLTSLPAWRQAVTLLYEEQASDPTDLAEMQRRSIVDTLNTFNTTLNPEILQNLAEIKLTGGKSSAWPGGAEQRDAVKNALRILRELWQNNRDAILRSYNDLDAKLAVSLPKLKQVFLATLGYYAELKTQRNVMDFDDLEINALKLLQNHSEVRRRWQRKVQALLVDEFQDTNARQRDLLDQLNGGKKKLFIVGDGKQSIYRFRGADVTVFRDIKARIEKAGLYYTLSESYRAHRELIALLNICLRPVLGVEDDSEAPWVEPFAPLTYVREEVRGCEKPFIELHLTAGSKVDGALQLAADVIASRLKTIVENSNAILGYDDIAILCRASTSFREYEDALDRAGIPFVTVSGRGFYERPEIRDVLNGIKAIADPTDDLALAGLLRSPACGISDMTLYRLLSLARDNARESLWEYILSYDFLQPAGEIIAEDVVRIEQALDLIQGLHNMVGRISVSDLLKRFLDRTDYRAALLRAGISRGVHNVTKLLSDAHKSGMVGISEFLSYIQGLKDSGSREGEAAILSEGTVRIMTVHAAKGLEFGVVVIGDAGRRELIRDDLLIDEEFGVLPVLSKRDPLTQIKTVPAVYGIAQERDRAKSSAEADRMLYVAATRAKEKLILSGTTRISKNGTLSLAGWLARIAGEDGLNLDNANIAYETEGNAAHDLSFPIQSNENGPYPVGCYIYEPNYLIPQQEMFTQPYMVTKSVPPYPLLVPLSGDSIIIDEETRNTEREPPRSVWRVVPVDERPTVPGWVVGSLVHTALGRWYFPAETGFYDWAEALVTGYGVTDKKARRYAVQNATRMLERFQLSALYHSIEVAERRLTEVPYTVINAAGDVEYGIVDVLYTLDGKWHLADYKTDYVRDSSALHDLLKTSNYIQQIERYMNAFKHLLGKRPLPNLCFLNYAGTVYSITDRW